MPRKVEIIESYIVDDNDYHWFDNYDELIRCKNCRYWGQDGYREGCKYSTCGMTENDYCSNAEPKVTE